MPILFNFVSGLKKHHLFLRTRNRIDKKSVSKIESMSFTWLLTIASNPTTSWKDGGKIDKKGGKNLLYNQHRSASSPGCQNQKPSALSTELLGRTYRGIGAGYFELIWPDIGISSTEIWKWTPAANSMSQMAHKACATGHLWKILNRLPDLTWPSSWTLLSLSPILIRYLLHPLRDNLTKFGLVDFISPISITESAKSDDFDM